MLCYKWSDASQQFFHCDFTYHCHWFLSRQTLLATSWHSNRYMQINLTCQKEIKKSSVNPGALDKMRPGTPMTGASKHRQTSPPCLPWPGHRVRVRVVQASTSRQHFLFWLIFPEFCRAVEMSGGGWTNHSARWGHVVPAGQSERRTGQTMLYEDVQQFVARGLTNICILPR